MNSKKGFTLIELMVVISIIALLSSVVLAALQDSRAKGRDAARIQAMIQVRNALQLYFADNGVYPACGSPYGDVVYQDRAFNPATNANSTWKNTLINGNYIKSIPNDIRYRSNASSTSSGVTCTNSATQKCLNYFLAVKLEKPNSALLFDRDINSGYASTSNPQYADGLTTLNYCVSDGPNAGSTATDLCYDLSSYRE
jgi:prepilin-type N-terminal cleavage/methylation domain-containing protein